MIFALFFIFAAVQLLKLSEPFNHFAFNVLTLGGPETDIGLMPAAPAPLSVDPLPVLLISPLPSSSRQVLEVVNAPQPSVGHTVVSVDALIALEQGRQPQPSHVWSHATALFGCALVVLGVVLLVRVAAAYARGNALIKAQLQELQKRELARAAELKRLQDARKADSLLADSAIQSLRKGKNTFLQKTLEQESLIQQMIVHAEAAETDRLELALDFEAQSGLMRAAREEATRQSSHSELLNATIARLESQQVAVQAENEDARRREDALRATIQSRDKQLRVAERKDADSKHRAAQLLAALATAAADADRQQQSADTTISGLRSAFGALQADVARLQGELAEAQGGAAALSHENDKLRGELYQALHDARVPAAEQDASLSMVNAQLLIVQKELAETKRQAAEEVEALEALLVQEDARSNTALATIGGADNAFVEDLAFTVDPQVPDIMPKELGPTEVRDRLPECPSTPPVDRRIAHSPCTQPSSCSSPSSYSAGPSPWVGRMTALFPELYDYDPSSHQSPSTDSDDLFGPSAPANFKWVMPGCKAVSGPRESPVNFQAAQIALVDELREQIADLEYDRAEDAAYIENLEFRLRNVQAAMEETQGVAKALMQALKGRGYVQ